MFGRVQPVVATTTLSSSLYTMVATDEYHKGVPIQITLIHGLSQ